MITLFGLSQSEIEDFTTFVDQMGVKLMENVHKGGWSQYTPHSLFLRLEEEVAELKQALVSFDSPDKITREAADVANFAMMIAATYAPMHRRMYPELYEAGDK